MFSYQQQSLEASSVPSASVMFPQAVSDNPVFNSGALMAERSRNVNTNQGHLLTAAVGQNQRPMQPQPVVHVPQQQQQQPSSQFSKQQVVNSSSSCSSQSSDSSSSSSSTGSSGAQRASLPVGSPAVISNVTKVPDSSNLHPANVPSRNIQRRTDPSSVQSLSGMFNHYSDHLVIFYRNLIHI